MRHVTKLVLVALAGVAGGAVFGDKLKGFASAMVPGTLSGRDKPARSRDEHDHDTDDSDDSAG